MQKEAYEKDKINIDEYFREIFREVNVTRRAAKFLQFQKFPAQTFDQIPKDLKGSLSWWAYENNITKYADVMGVGMAYNWVFKDVFNLIDSGGVYRIANPARGASEPPKFTDKEAAEQFNLNQPLIKQVFEATQHPYFIRNLADKFISEVMGLENHRAHEFIGLHFRFNPGDFFEREFLNRTEAEADGNHIPNFIAKHLYRSLNDPRYLVENLIDYLEKDVYPKMEKSETSPKSSLPKTLFITSPKNIADKLATIENHSYKGYTVFTTADSEKFLDFYRKCQSIDDLFGDILSTLEKEILLRSLVFFRARPSNWSFNIQGHRFAKYLWEEIKYDRVVFDIFAGK